MNSGTRSSIAAIPFFTGLAVLQTWPLARFAGSRVTDAGDGLLNVWVLTTVARRLLTHPLALFDVNAYYPFRDALATLDHQIGAAVLVAPLTLVTDNALLAANLFTIATFVLSGVFMAMLVDELTGSIPAGLLAGSIFAFSGLRIENINHTHVLGTCWLPLVLLAWHRFSRRPEPGRAVVLTAAALVFALTTWYHAVMGPVALAVVAAAGWREWRGRVRPIAAGTLLAAVVGGLVLVPLARPYVRIAREYLPRVPHASDVAGTGGDGSEEGAIDRTSAAPIQQSNAADVESYVAAGGSTRVPWTAPLRARSRAGVRAFPGYAAALLALGAALLVMGAQVRASRWAWITIALTAVLSAAVLAAATGRGLPVLALTRLPGFVAAVVAGWLAWLVLRPLDPLLTAGRTYLVLAIVGAVLSFGPEVFAFGVPVGDGIYPSQMPPFNLLRASARFGILAVLGGAVLAGVAFARATSGWSRPATLVTAGLLLCLVNVEVTTAPIGLLRVGRAPLIYEWLRDAPPGPVVEFPVHENVWALYWALGHRQPLVNGAGLIEPAAFLRLKEADDLSPAMVEHLRAYFRPRYVVVNTGAYTGARREMLDAQLARSADALVPRVISGGRSVFELMPSSTGTLVLRSFPPWMAEHAERVVVRAHLASAVPAGVDPVIEIWGNGQRLSPAAATGDARKGPGAALPQDTRAGLDVEVIADYTRSGGAGEAIGRTGRTSPSDISLAVGPDRTRLQVNGHVWTGRKGYTVVALDTEGRVADIRAFNTSWSEAESHAMADFIHALDDGRIVAVASGYDASRALTADAVNALQSLGMSADLRGRFRWAHAAVGVKGAPPGTALEALDATSATCTIGVPLAIRVTVEEVTVQE